MSVKQHVQIHTRAVLASLLAGICLSSGVFAQTSIDGLKLDGGNAQGITITAEQERDLLAAMGESGAIGLTRYYYPALGAGIPTGFGASWGDVFFSVSGSNSDKIREEYDGSMSATMGFGNPSRILGLELSANNLSMRNFGDNWSFDGKVHRMLYEGEKGFLSLAVGRNNLACSGNDACSNNVSSNYVVLSGVTPVKNPFGSGTVPLSASLGMGNGFYSYNQDRNTRFSPFGDIGIQLHDQVGVGVGWSGVGLNANVSFVPVREWPVIFNLLFADITDRSSGGFNVILTAGIRFNFL